MEDGYSTFNVREIDRKIFNAVEKALYNNRHNQEHWDAIIEVKTYLLEEFGILDSQFT